MADQAPAGEQWERLADGYAGTVQARLLWELDRSEDQVWDEDVSAARAALDAHVRGLREERDRLRSIVSEVANAYEAWDADDLQAAARAALDSTPEQPRA